MKVFRENSKAIFDDLKKRNMVDDNAKEVIQNDQKWRDLIDEGNKLRAQRNSISKKIGELKKKGKDGNEPLQKMSDIKKRLIENESKTKSALELRERARMQVPNILDKKVPKGNALLLSYPCSNDNIPQSNSAERADRKITKKILKSPSQ